MADTKAGFLAERIAAFKAKHEKELDTLHARVDELETVAPVVYEHVHDLITSQQKDVQGLAEDLQHLSNVPLGEGTLSAVSKIISDGAKVEADAKSDVAEVKADAAAVEAVAAPQ